MGTTLLIAGIVLLIVAGGIAAYAFYGTKEGDLHSSDLLDDADEQPEEPSTLGVQDTHVDGITPEQLQEEEIR